MGSPMPSTRRSVAGGQTPVVDVADPATLPVPPGSAQILIASRPGAPQSELRIGHVAAARNSTDYHALVALNLVLGGQFVSRINTNLRGAQGLHLWRAHQLRFQARTRALRAPRQRAVGCHGRRPERGPLRAERDARRAASMVQKRSWSSAARR